MHCRLTEMFSEYVNFVLYKTTISSKNYPVKGQSEEITTYEDSVSKGAYRKGYRAIHLLVMGRTLLAEADR